MPIHEGHVAAWPPWRDKKPRQRTLAYCATADSSPIITEHGQLFIVPIEPSLFVEILITERMELFTDDLSFWVWYLYSAPGIDFSVSCTQQGTISAVRIKDGRRTAWISNLGTWNLPDTAASIFKLRALLTYVGIGTYLSPGALGDTLARSLWSGPRTPRPNGALRFQLLANMVGGRVDGPNEYRDVLFPTVWELDLSSAYVRCALSLPVGTAVAVYRNIQHCGFSAYFCHCRIRIRERLFLGVFPIRDEAQVTYPRDVGTYEAWLWSDEIDAAADAGCAVETLEGWGWEGNSNAMAGWVEAILSLRSRAPTPDVEAMVKHAAVATIGRHGMHPHSFALEQGRPNVGDRILIDADGYLTDLVIRRVEQPNMPRLTHWFSYIAMQVRLSIYRQALHEINRQNEVLSINYDAVYTRYEPEPIVEYPKIVELHEASFPYPRAIIAHEKTRLPGIALALR